MSEIKQESPLAGRAEALHGTGSAAEAGVTLRERPFLGHISLRGKSEDRAFTGACEKVLGMALPAAPNTQVEGDGVIVGWVRPTEWLVLAESEACQQRLDGLRTELGDLHSGVVDVSGGQTVIEVRGKHAVDTLSKGTTLDLHPRSFAAGCCTRTLMAHSTIFIRVIEPGHAFEIVIRRSFADHLWRWLSDCAEEYGCAVGPPESSLQYATRPAEAS